MNMKLKIQLILCLLPFSLAAQWTQLGNFIDGKSADTKLGSFNSIALDSLGTTLAAGSPYFSDSGQFFGYAQVYDLVGGQWVDRGVPFQGSDSLEGTGAAVSLSATGNTVAVSSPWAYNSLGYKCGVVNVYDWNGSEWIIRGATIEGEGNPSPAFEGCVFGHSICLSPDGNYIAIGAISNTQQVGVLQLQGSARVYHWDGQSWVQMGQDLDGVRSLEEFGHSVSINANGTRLAVGGKNYSGVVAEGGIVRTYEWNGQSWDSLAPSFRGTELGANLGSSVSLNRDGNTLVIGSPKSNNQYGITQVFDWNGAAWVQRGSDIPGTAGNLGPNSGTAIDVSEDGNFIAIGEPLLNFYNGGAKVMRWDGSNWVQVDNPITGVGPMADINVFGSAICMNADGSRIVIGAPFHDTNGNNAGRVYVFENNTVVSTGNAAEWGFHLYPNPASGPVHLIARHDIQRITLYNVLGVKVWEQTGASREMVLDLSPLVAGTYVVRLESEGQVRTSRIIKQ